MKKLIIFALVALLPIQLLGAETKKALSPKEILKVKAAQYSVSAPIMEKIITCESNWNPKVQSRHIYPKDIPKVGIKKGTRERSYGLVQINLDWNPNVTYAEATDTEFAVDYLAKGIKAGKARAWTCAWPYLPQLYPKSPTSTKVYPWTK